MRFRKLVAGFFAAALIATTGVTFAPGSAADAATRKDVEKQQAENAKQRKKLDAELEDTDEDLKAAYLKLKDAEDDLKVAQVELQVAESQYASAKREADELADRLGQAETQRTEVEAQIKENEGKIQEAEDSIAEMARDAAASGSSADTNLSLLLGSDSLPDLLNTVQSADIAAKAQQDALYELEQERSAMANQKARLQAIEKEIASLKAQADAKAAEAAAAKQRAAQKQAQIQKIIADQKDLTTKLEAVKAQAVERQKVLDAKKKQLDAEMAAIQKKEQEEYERQVAAGKTPANPPASKGFFGYPVVNGTISSPFGMRYHPILHYWRLHAGTDFAEPCGTPIYAAAPGKVQWARYSGGDGNQVMINHGIVGGKSTATGYSHTSKMYVKAGQRVKKGQLIAKVGTTGLSTGCHLHFSMWKNGSPVNAMKYY